MNSYLIQVSCDAEHPITSSCVNGQGEEKKMNNMLMVDKTSELFHYNQTAHMQSINPVVPWSLILTARPYTAINIWLVN